MRKPLEQVDTFIYLGSAITRDSYCATEIRMRLAKGYAVATLYRSEEDLEEPWYQSNNKNGAPENIGMAGCNIRMQRLDNEEGRGEENRSVRDEMFKNDNANIVDGKANKQMGAGKSRSREEVTRDSKRKKNEILWTHHEKGGIMLEKRDHSRHGSGRTGKRKTEDRLDRLYKNMDRTNTGGLDKNDGRQKTLEEHRA